MSYIVINDEPELMVYACEKYYDNGDTKRICHLLKNSNSAAQEMAAIKMAKLVPKDAVLVPIPGHYGLALHTAYLAELIALNANCELADVLRCYPHISMYDAKKKCIRLTEEDLGMYVLGDIPQNKTICLIDNVYDTGVTASAAADAILNELQIQNIKYKEIIIITYAINV